MSGSTWNPPSSPTVGEIYTFAGAQWQWNGTAWVNANTLGTPFVPIAGGTMTGPLLFSGGGSYVPQNYVDNSGFTINQRVYTSGTALAAGAYGFDRWKGGPAAGGTLTFSGSPASTIVTISAGSIQQVIEGLNMLSETYTLSWSGNAQGRIATTSGGGTYAASPIVFPGVANTNTFIEFQGGALGQVQLQIGGVATPWQPQPFALELARAMRFFQPSQVSFWSFPAGVGTIGTSWALLVPMRATPTVAGGSWTNTGNTTNAMFGPIGVAHAYVSGTASAAGPAALAGNFTLSADL